MIYLAITQVRAVLRVVVWIMGVLCLIGCWQTMWILVRTNGWNQELLRELRQIFRGPDPLYRWEWFILGAIAGGLILGGCAGVGGGAESKWQTREQRIELTTRGNVRRTLAHEIGHDVPGLIMAFVSPTRFDDTLRDAWDPKLRRQG